MIPDSLLQTLSKLKGYNMQSFIEAHKKIAPTSVRLNSKKLIADFDSQKKVVWCEGAYYLNERPSFTYSPLFHAGCYYVQEASSMFLNHIIKYISIENKFDTALDLCAAPGGKSTLLLDVLSEDCLLVSNELINNRVSVLIENLNKWGRINNVVTNNEAEKFSKLSSFFDLVLVDAPCSGSGLFRKDNNATKEWSLNNVEMCSIRQSKILNDVLPSLNSNGYLVYSTCSYSKSENEDIADYMIDNFGLESVNIPYQESWGIVETNSDKYKAYGYRFYPDKVDGEGFFITVFRNRNNGNIQRKNNLKNNNYSKLSPKKFESFVNFGNDKILLSRNDFNCCIFNKHYEKIEFITNFLNIKKVGVEVGNFMHSDFIPSHSLALSSLLKLDIVKIDLDLNDAIKYLKKENVTIKTEHVGWAIASYKGFALGWMKVLKNRINNYYPKNSRILH